MTLLLGRWLLGFCFPHSDLELLDDPLPSKLYCRRFRETSPTKDIEVGLEEPDGDIADGESQPVNLNGTAITSEPRGQRDEEEEEEEDGEPSARNALFGVKGDSDFNITQEMDNCDLWKNLVKTYDAPPSSPRRQSTQRGGIPAIIEESNGIEDHMHSKPSACRRLELYHSTAV